MSIEVYFISSSRIDSQSFQLTTNLWQIFRFYAEKKNKSLKKVKFVFGKRECSYLEMILEYSQMLFRLLCYKRRAITLYAIDWMEDNPLIPVLVKTEYGHTDIKWYYQNNTIDELKAFINHVFFYSEYWLKIRDENNQKINKNKRIYDIILQFERPSFNIVCGKKKPSRGLCADRKTSSNKIHIGNTSYSNSEQTVVRVRSCVSVFKWRDIMLDSGKIHRQKRANLRTLNQPNPPILEEFIEQ